MPDYANHDVNAMQSEMKDQAESETKSEKELFQSQKFYAKFSFDFRLLLILGVFF